MIDLVISQSPQDEFTKLQCLENYVRIFRDFVWHAGLQKIVEDHPKRGMSSDSHNDIILMTYVMAGRVMLTFQGPDFSVTTLAAEGEVDSGMGLHGIDGTFSEAIIAIEAIKSAYNTSKLTMSACSDVSII